MSVNELTPRTGIFSKKQIDELRSLGARIEIDPETAKYRRYTYMAGKGETMFKDHINLRPEEERATLYVPEQIPTVVYMRTLLRGSVS